LPARRPAAHPGRHRRVLRAGAGAEAERAGEEGPRGLHALSVAPGWPRAGTEAGPDGHDACPTGGHRPFFSENPPISHPSAVGTTHDPDGPRYGMSFSNGGNFDRASSRSFDTSGNACASIEAYSDRAALASPDRSAS